tara:strand:+ start:133651 stop:133911 length:261 start_codon:yes stop_codon:yes gene_type:complete
MKQNSKFKIATMVMLAALLSGCTFDENFRSYVRAHRLAYNVTTPHYSALVTADTTLSDPDKALHLRRVKAEEDMISNAEKLLGIIK